MDVGLIEASYGTGQYRAITNPLQLVYVVKAAFDEPVKLQIWSPAGIREEEYAEWYGHETPMSTVLWWFGTFNIAKSMGKNFRQGQARIALPTNKIFFVLGVSDDTSPHSSKVRVVSNWVVSSTSFSDSNIYQDGPEVFREEESQTTEHPSRFERDIEKKANAVPRKSR